MRRAANEAALQNCTATPATREFGEVAEDFVAGAVVRMEPHRTSEVEKEVAAVVLAAAAAAGVGVAAGRAYRGHRRDHFQRLPGANPSKTQPKPEQQTLSS
jgi:hypothetical protein